MFPNTPEPQRRVFGPYDCGNGYIHADPFRVRRRLAQLLPGDKAKELLDQWHSPAPEYALAAAEQFLDAVAAAFEIHRFDPMTGQGATEDALITIWNAWQDWTSKKNGIAPTCPTSSPATDSPLA